MPNTRTAGIGAVLLACGGMLAAPEALALRCGTRIIQEGDHVSKLKRYCGEPHTVETRWAQRTFVANVEDVVFPGVVAEVRIEDWTYNFGPRRLMRMITLEDGFVVHIKQLGYGFLEH